MNNFSKDRRLDKLLQRVVHEVKSFAEDQIRQIQVGADIGLALSAKTDLNELFEKIVDQARRLSNADGGTLYTLEKDKKHLCFRILQNESLGIRMGGTSDFQVNLPSVPLYLEDGSPNNSNVSSHVAITGRTVNISDVYQYKGFDFSGTRSYDETTGYQSKSMLVIPLKNHEDEIIGVLQLLNAKDPNTGEVVEFFSEYVDLVRSLASQAAVALTNTQLIQDLRNLLHAFIESIATAIDKKSPYTGDHIRRVVDLTMMISKEINDTMEGPFRKTSFSDEELEELKLAAWMHDVGKITTPEYLVDKANKLETIFDRIDLIETRFQLAAKDIENRFLKKKIELMTQDPDEKEIIALHEAFQAEIKSLDEDLEFIKSCNRSSEFMNDENIERIRKIAEKRYVLYGKKYPYLTENEVTNLCIRKGTLTDEERKVIESHALMTYNILQKLPFPNNLKNVPIYAAGHHLRPDGKGYPEEFSDMEMPLQSRIMAVADIFEALTARDRPYKKPMKVSQAIRILQSMKDDGHIDPDIFDLFIEREVFKKYAKKELSEDQIDMDFF